MNDIVWMTHAMRQSDWYKKHFATCNDAMRGVEQVKHWSMRDIERHWHPTRALEYPWALQVAPPVGDILDIGSDLKWLMALSAANKDADIIGHRTWYDLDMLTRSTMHNHIIDCAPWLKTHASRVGFVYGMPWHIKGTYDTVYCISTIEHVDPADWRRWLDAIVRCVAPGGKLCLTVDRMIDKPDNAGHTGMWNHPVGEYFGKPLPPPDNDALVLEFQDHGRLAVYGMVVDL